MKNADLHALRIVRQNGFIAGVSYDLHKRQLSLLADITLRNNVFGCPVTVSEFKVIERLIGCSHVSGLWCAATLAAGPYGDARRGSRSP